jgi:hypothetical protein
MARLLWSAFECSSLAGHLKEIKEKERLFNLGYKSGRGFFTALEENRIEKAHISEEVPMVVTIFSEGPSVDFKVGRVYSAAQEEALRDVVKSGERLNSEETQQLLARAKFNRQNCRLLGTPQ